MKMLLRSLTLGTAIVSAFTLVSCSQTPLNSPTSPTADATSAGTALVGNENPGDPGDGHVHTEFLQVCKTADSNVAGTFSIVQTGSGNGSFISPITVQPGACVVAAVGNNVLAVTETSAGFVSATIDTLNDTTLTTGSFVNGSSVTLSGQLGHTIRVKNRIEEPPPPPPGGQGCTPGYWRQEHHYDSWRVYSPGADFDVTFGVNFFNPDITLGVAVALGGGDVNALARHGVAALLNAATGAGVAYQYTTAQVIAIVRGTGAYASLSVEARKDLLAAANEAGCPLN